ncbi:hypothetical protein BDZ88DRAFT_420861 [Geranomyces variabilis]|nr:hypothetical protein BDZ88DRAFT_420861 [Geranomyces variabilis]KAJ3138396.1 hypothetical protein HDU90_001359 [Geranomyces variabilis]
MTGRRPSLLQQAFTPRQFPNYDNVHHLSDPFKPEPDSSSAASSSLQYKVPALDGFGGPRMSGEFQSRSPLDPGGGSRSMPMLGPGRMDFNRNPMMMRHSLDTGRRNPIIAQRSHQNHFQPVNEHRRSSAVEHQRQQLQHHQQSQQQLQQQPPQQSPQQPQEQLQQQQHQRQLHQPQLHQRQHQQPQHQQQQQLQQQPQHLPHQQHERHGADLGWPQQLSQHVASIVPFEFQEHTAQYSRPYLPIHAQSFDPNSIPLASPALSTHSEGYSNSYPDLFSPVERTSLDFYVTPADQLLGGDVTSPYDQSYPTTPVAQSSSSETPAPGYDPPAQYSSLQGNPLADFNPSSGWLDNSWESFGDIDVTEQFTSSPTATADELVAPTNDCSEDAYSQTKDVSGESPQSPRAGLVRESPAPDNSDCVSEADEIVDDAPNPELPADGEISRDASRDGDAVVCPHPGCSRTFLKYQNMRAHFKTHSVSKPHQCPTCELRFRRNHDLKRHSRLHTKERPYRCATCPEAYARSDALKRHNKYPCGTPHPRTKKARKQSVADASSSSYTGAEGADADAEAETARAIEEMQLQDPQPPPPPPPSSSPRASLTSSTASGGAFTDPSNYDSCDAVGDFAQIEVPYEFPAVDGIPGEGLRRRTPYDSYADDLGPAFASPTPMSFFGE